MLHFFTYRHEALYKNASEKHRGHKKRAKGSAKYIRDLQAEVKRLSSRPRSSTPDLTQEESRHPAFDPFFSILSSMTEFNAFEQMILVPENRKKMVFGFSFELLCYFHF